MTAYEVPLIAAPQSFGIALANVQYQLTLRWCEPAGSWMLDIADASQNPILSGLPLVPKIDLLAQYGYLNFGGSLFVQSLADINQIPTFTSLGTDGLLFFVTTP